MEIKSWGDNLGKFQYLESNKEEKFEEKAYIKWL